MLTSPSPAPFAALVASGAAGRSASSSASGGAGGWNPAKIYRKRSAYSSFLPSLRLLLGSDDVVEARGVSARGEGAGGGKREGAAALSLRLRITNPTPYNMLVLLLAPPPSAASASAVSSPEGAPPSPSLAPSPSPGQTHEPTPRASNQLRLVDTGTGAPLETIPALSSASALPPGCIAAFLLRANDALGASGGSDDGADDVVEEGKEGAGGASVDGLPEEAARRGAECALASHQADAGTPHLESLLRCGRRALLSQSGSGVDVLCRRGTQREGGECDELLVRAYPHPKAWEELGAVREKEALTSRGVEIRALFT